MALVVMIQIKSRFSMLSAKDCWEEVEYTSESYSDTVFQFIIDHVGNNNDRHYEFTRGVSNIVRISIDSISSIVEEHIRITINGIMYTRINH